MKKYLAILVAIIGMASYAQAADVKISELPAATAVTADDLFVITDSPASSPTSKKVAAANMLTYFQAAFTGTPEQGDILYYNGTNWVMLNHGTAGQILKSGGHGANPSWTGTLSITSITGTAITPAEVDGHTDQTALTAANVSNTVITNYGQGAADVFLLLPAAAAGYSFLATVATAQANHFGVEAAANDKIYLIAADGTIAAGDDAAGVVMTAAQVGQQFACWTFRTGASAFDWACKAIAIGTSTFAAHAHSTP